MSALPESRHERIADRLRVVLHYDDDREGAADALVALALSRRTPPSPPPTTDDPTDDQAADEAA